MKQRTTLTIGGMLLVAAMAAVCGGSYSPAAPTTGTPTPTPTPTPTTPAPAVADVTITIVGMNGAQSFSPNPANVKVGQTVAWRNADSESHTATADSRAFDTGSIGRAATSAPIAQMSAGSIPYHCAIHPSMTGTLNVTQ